MDNVEQEAGGIIGLQLSEGRAQHLALDDLIIERDCWASMADQLQDACLIDGIERFPGNRLAMTHERDGPTVGDMEEPATRGRGIELAHERGVSPLCRAPGGDVDILHDVVSLLAATGTGEMVHERVQSGLSRLKEVSKRAGGQGVCVRRLAHVVSRASETTVE